MLNERAAFLASHIQYILAMPVYCFYLPLYAFWHFDDFSWGNTRLVVDDEGSRYYAPEMEEVHLMVLYQLIILWASMLIYICFGRL
jgi:hypothetical protein